MRARNHIKKTIKVIFCMGIVAAMSVYAPDATAQRKGKSTYEKGNEKKNKANRKQTRRGDKARSNKGKLRFLNFKTRNKQGDKSYKGDITGRRVITKRSVRPSPASYARANPYAGRKRSTEASRAKAFKQTPRYSSRSSERAWRGNSAARASGRSIRTTFTSNRYSRNVRSVTRNPERSGIKSRRIVPLSASGAYQVKKRKNPYIWREKSKWEKAYSGDITGRKFRSKSSPNRPVILQSAPTIRFSSKARKGDRSYSGKLQGGYQTASKPGERAWKKDISGTKLRIRTTGRPKFTGPQYQPYLSKGKQGDRAYKGRISGGNYRTTARKSEVAGKKVFRPREPGLGTQQGIRFQGNIRSGTPPKGSGGSISFRTRNNKGRPLDTKKTQNIGVARFQGNLRGGKPLKGGGSISFQTRNNKGRALDTRKIQSQDLSIAGFQGKLKGSKPFKGGGSISFQIRNNKGRPLDTRKIQSQDLSVAGFQGNLKGGKPLKGGGSISFQTRNNKGRPLDTRKIQSQDLSIAGFQGNLKGGRSLKGGGSISRRWNNKGRPIEGRSPQAQDNEIAKFQGNVKRLEVSGYSDGSATYKGAIPRHTLPTYNTSMSVSRGQLKNRRPYIKNPSAARLSLKVKEPDGNNLAMSSFQGRFKKFELNPGTGSNKAAIHPGDQKRKRGYIKNPNASKLALKVKEPTKTNTEISKFQGTFRRFELTPGYTTDGATIHPGNIRVTKFDYTKNPNSAKEALKARTPEKNMKLTADFQGRQKSRINYTQNPSATKESLKSIPASAATQRAMSFKGRTKLSFFYYSKNSLASKEALKGIGPSRAAVQASNYQGNIKMKRKRIEDRHPDFKYLATHKNGKEEKDKLFSFRLMWSKFFKKDENQPDFLKEKQRPPRYDKGEQGLWND